MFSKLSLKKKLSFFILTILSFCLVSIMSYSYIKSSELISEEAHNRLSLMTDHHGLEISKFLDEAFVSTRMLADSAIALKEGPHASREDLLALVKLHLKLSPLYYGVGTYWERNAYDGKDELFLNHAIHGGISKGRMAMWVRQDEKSSLAIDPIDSVEMETPGAGDWYLEYKNNPKEGFTEPYEYETAAGKKVLIMTPTVPLMIGDRFFGIATTDILVDTVVNLVGGIKPYEVGFATLISSEGNYLYNPDHSLVGKALAKDSEVAKKIESKNFDQFESFDSKQTAYFNTIRPISLGDSGKNWYLVISVPKAKILEGSQRLAQIQMVLGIVSLVLVSLVILMLAFGITKPLTVQNQEVDQVASHLNDYSDNLLSISKTLEASSQAQSNALIQTSSAMDEINSMVSRNNDSAKRSKLASDENRFAAIEGKKATEQLLVSMGHIQTSTGRISEQTEKGNREFKEIVKIINQISEKTKFINEIVFQTKLLSFNASVEAARAGEHGRGFSIVAEEVGNLAEVSGKASQEISDLLLESTKKVEAIVVENEASIGRLIKDSTKEVEDGIGLMREFSAKFDDIVTKSMEVGSLVEEIVEASHQQTIGVSEVSLAINHLDSEAQKNSSMAKEASTAANEVKSNSSHLKVIVSELDKIIEGKKDAA